jgi:uncharacterized membrane protein
MVLREVVSNMSPIRSSNPLAAAAQPIAGSGAPGLPAAGDGAGFRALLTPHRSLGPQGFLILMVGVGLVCFGTGLFFFMLGAWPVLVFCGLDVALVYLAFKLNYRAARMHEAVHLTEDALLVKRVHTNGREESWTFHPYWVRLAVTQDEHTERTELRLRSHGQELVVGHFLSDPEKLDFANALSSALHAFRAGRAPA